MRSQSKAAWGRAGGSSVWATLTWTFVCLLAMGLIVSVVASV